jgi:hypothetical protein
MRTGIGRGDIADPVDAVTIKNDGTITWNAIKKDCKENED